MRHETRYGKNTALCSKETDTTSPPLFYCPAPEGSRKKGCKHFLEITTVDSGNPRKVNYIVGETRWKVKPCKQAWPSRTMNICTHNHTLVCSKYACITTTASQEKQATPDCCSAYVNSVKLHTGLNGEFRARPGGWNKGTQANNQVDWHKQTSTSGLKQRVAFFKRGLLHTVGLLKTMPRAASDHIVPFP